MSTAQPMSFGDRQQLRAVPAIEADEVVTTQDVQAAS